jgi:pSer/pThr/pTyr-binding forkhead associated (FHA) protein
VSSSAIDRDGVTPRDLQERIRADRRGDPYLLLRDDAHRQQIIALNAQLHALTIGRATGCDVCLRWDDGVSRAHARLERLGTGAWMLVDDGLSRNGSIVNGERLRQRRRLADGDVLRFGDTFVVYRAPASETHRGVTVVAPGNEIELTAAQRRVLIELCRPYRDRGEFATPATNQEIADRLVLSIEAVKTQLRALFERFDVEPLARDAKRTRLVQRAFETGVISRQDLD